MKPTSRRSAAFIPQNIRFYLVVGIFLFVIVGVLFFKTDLLKQTVSSNQVNQTVSSNQPDQSDLTNGSTRRRPRDAPAFWDSAVVPDPGEDPPVVTIRPEDLGVIAPTTPVDSQALIIKAISENDLPAIHSAALVWFQQDPAAARDWLSAQSTLEDLQPAISYIASSISEKGDIKTGIEWVKLLPEGTLREDTLFNMHALALRNGQITFSEINPEGISPERLQELQSGAAGD